MWTKIPSGISALSRIGQILYTSYWSSVLEVVRLRFRRPKLPHQPPHPYAAASGEDEARLGSLPSDLRQQPLHLSAPSLKSLLPSLNLAAGGENGARLGSLPSDLRQQTLHLNAPSLKSLLPSLTLAAGGEDDARLGSPPSNLRQQTLHLNAPSPKSHTLPLPFQTPYSKSLAFVGGNHPEYLRTVVSNLLGIAYLSEVEASTPEEVSGVVTPRSTGYISLPVQRLDKSRPPYAIHFLVDPGSPDTVLSKQVSSDS